MTSSSPRPPRPPHPAHLAHPPTREPIATPAAPIEAVLFDLDDTLFDQGGWLHGAWRAVAARAAEWDVPADVLVDALEAAATDGTDRGRIIDRALADVGADAPVGPLVDAFRAHAPAVLEPYPGVADALDRLGARVALGLVTDGDPGIQRAKLRALGLEEQFAAVVYSDEHGRAHRKPDPLPFRLALDALGTSAERAVYVGDRPDKDIAGAAAIGMRTVRVRTGEWRNRADDARTWRTADDIGAAVDLLLPLVDPAGPA